MLTTKLRWLHKRRKKSSRFCQKQASDKDVKTHFYFRLWASSYLISRLSRIFFSIWICHSFRLPPFVSSHIRISRSFPFRWRRYLRDFNPIARTSLLFSAKISTPTGSIFPKILAIANPYTFDSHRNENDRCDEKTHKKMSDKRVADSSVETQLPQLSDPHK